MIDHRLLTFLEVCNYMNFTKAAESLYITQPAVTQQMKTLEEHYQTKLFGYEGKRLMLTKAGEELRHYALALKADSEKVFQAVRSAEEMTARLSFGATLTLGEFVLWDVLGSYIDKHPKTQVTMKVDNTSKLLESLKDGSIDFAFIEGYYLKDEYEVIKLFEDQFVAVCSADSRFAKGTYRLQDLYGERLIVREEGSGTREVLERVLAQKNEAIAKFSLCTQIGNINVIKKMVEKSLGITFLYEAAVRQEIIDGKLAKISLEDFAVSKEYTFVCLKNSCFLSEYQNFIKELFQNSNVILT